MTLAAGTRLGPYEILSPLGAGGMGEVYRAKDARLDREVAIKVLPESFASDPEALARFEREAKAVAALSHPNILAIFDFGTHEGVAYAVTELLSGETLRAKLGAGAIPRKLAVAYALQVCQGLAAAHEKGLIHRDLKPENIFVGPADQVKILDFGLAKRMPPLTPGAETSDPTDTAFTSPGTVMGTLGYMSPEQLRGVAVDQRSDIFSLGSVLYELFSGQRAFQRDTVGDTMAAILKEDPPELSGWGRNVPPGLDHIVRHCLEKDPKSRFQSASDIAFALAEESSPVSIDRRGSPAENRNGRRALAGAVTVAVLLAGGWLLWRRGSETAERPGALKRIAVLPFENLGSADDDYFADGIADAVRGKLTSVPGIEVIARTSSLAYKKTRKPPKQIADELGVPYLLTATVRWQKEGATNRVQVSPELMEVDGARAPASKWQQPFDAQLTDVFEVQSDIASRVARELGAVLGPKEVHRLSETPTANLAAYDAFLRGQEAMASSQRKALDYYEQAVSLDPGFARAWAYVSSMSSFMFWFATPTAALAERARMAAEKAIALAPDRPEGYVAYADYRGFVLSDNRGAEEQYQKSLHFGPITAEALQVSAGIQARLGRWGDALVECQRALRLDPRSIAVIEQLGSTLLLMGRTGEAREMFDRGLGIAPAGIYFIEGKAETFLAEGDLARARLVIAAAPKEVDSAQLVSTLANVDDLVWLLTEPQLEILLHLTPGAFDDNRAAWSICLTQAYALRGDIGKQRAYADEARKAYEEQLRSAPQDAQRHAFLGLAFAYLGRKDEAIWEGTRAVTLVPRTKDAYSGQYFETILARIHTLVGEPDKALDEIEILTKIPSGLTPGFLKIDPDFAPLRANPRFQKLIASVR